MGEAESADLDTLYVGRVEGLSSEPNRYQNDDRFPGLVARITWTLT